jgi:hypothetical protein
LLNEKHATYEYKIKKIENHKNFYIIYASRNDSLFKIIADKEDSVSCSYCEKIHRGGWYKLNLRDKNRQEFDGGYINDYLAIRLIYFGEYVPLEKRSHNRIYWVDNLEGMQLIQDNPLK